MISRALGPFLLIVSVAVSADERPTLHRLDSWVDLTAGVRWDFDGDRARETREKNACALVQGALNPYLDVRKHEGGGRHHRVRISGTAEITAADLRRVRTFDAGTGKVRDDGPYDYCFGLIPTGGGVCRGAGEPKPCVSDAQCRGGGVCRRGPGVDDGFPVSDGTRITISTSSLNIHWDDTRIRYDPDANDDGVSDQKRPAVIYQRGDQFVSGRGGGSIIGGVVEYGFRQIEIVDEGNTRPPWTSGRVVPMDVDTLVASPSTTIVEFTFGVFKPDVSRLGVHYEGASEDTDDIGILQVDSWGHRRIGGMHARKFNAVVQHYANTASSLSNCYFSWQPHGTSIVLGDPVNSGSRMHWSRCVFGGGRCKREQTAVTELDVSNCVVEGARWGNIAMFSGGSSLSFNRLHLEHATEDAHNVLIGAGMCDGRTGTGELAPEGRTCGGDRECSSNGDGLCVIAADRLGRSALRRIEFVGCAFGKEPGHPVYDTLHLGKGATNEEGLIRFESEMARSTDGKSKKDYFFLADPAAKVRVNFDGSRAPRNLVYPDYDHVVSAHTIVVADWQVDIAGLSPPACIQPFVRADSAVAVGGKPCESPSQQVTLPAGRWWLKRLTLHPTAPSADVQCTVSVELTEAGSPPTELASIQFPSKGWNRPGKVAELALNRTVGGSKAARLALRVSEKRGESQCIAASGRCGCSEARFHAVAEAIRYP